MVNVNLYTFLLRVHDFFFGNAEMKYKKELQERSNNEIQVMEFDVSYGFAIVTHH